MEKLPNENSLDLKKLLLPFLKTRKALTLLFAGIALAVSPLADHAVAKSRSAVVGEPSTPKKSPATIGGGSSIFESKSGKAYLISIVCGGDDCRVAAAHLEGPNHDGLYEVGESLDEKEKREILLEKEMNEN